jgi:hypothetical protein
VYEVDEQDQVKALTDVPQSSAGAPVPLVVSDEHRLVVAYYVEESAPGPHAAVRGLGPEDAQEPVAIVRFNVCRAQMWGPPNDEAFAGHPLASRGLHPYGAFEVVHSSWIRRLERMNAVHPRHRPEVFWQLRHVVLAFHDTTLECVCGGFDVTIVRGSIASVVPEMVKLLEWAAG